MVKPISSQMRLPPHQIVYENMRNLTLTSVMLTFLLVACGYKGALYLPKKSNQPTATSTTSESVVVAKSESMPKTYSRNESTFP